jgi:hypothetical protein
MPTTWPSGDIELGQKPVESASVMAGDGAELRAYYLRSVVPMLLAAIGLGGLLVIAMTAYLRAL